MFMRAFSTPPDWNTTAPLVTLGVFRITCPAAGPEPEAVPEVMVTFPPTVEPEPVPAPAVIETSPPVAEVVELKPDAPAIMTSPPP
jgi:hypothetical protein